MSSSEVESKNTGSKSTTRKRIEKTSRTLLLSLQIGTGIGCGIGLGSAVAEGVMWLNADEKIYDTPNYITESGRHKMVHSLENANKELCGIIPTDEGRLIPNYADVDSADENILAALDGSSVNPLVTYPLVQARNDISPYIQSNEKVACNNDIFVDTRNLISKAAENVESYKDLPETQRRFIHYSSVEDAKSDHAHRTKVSVLLFIAGATSSSVLGIIRKEKNN